MQSILTKCIVFCALISGLMSCMSDPDFSSNPNKLLTFSADTLRFDTLFADVPSATRWLKVYNRNKEPLLINDIRLSSETKEFRINVDGESGSVFQNIEILGKDSIFIAVETTLKPAASNDPVIAQDAILFSFNGITQKIELEALSWDAIKWDGMVVNKHLTLTSEKPYLIYDSLYVAPDALLDIKAGTRIFFHKKARLIVDGSIHATGQQGMPVVFRGDRLDDMLSGLPYDKVSGQWEGISFSEKSYDNKFDYCDIHSSVNAIRIEGKSMTSLQPQLIIKNSLIHNSLKTGLWAKNTSLSVSGSQITNSGENLLDLNGGVYNFVNCTIANLYSFGAVYGYAVNVSSEEKELSLIMRNSIVWGKNRNEIYIPSSATNNITYKFENSLLKGKEEQTENYQNIIWNIDPRFKAKGTDHYFDFRLDSASVARGLGKQPISPAPDIDFYGVNRNVENPDAGAFQYSGEK
ncbi:MAG: right-handed parallel beta-helix repeat-containing protein [Bacteroidales bacterium]